MKTFKEIFFPLLGSDPEFLRGKKIIDFPAGSGETSNYLLKLNLDIEVHSFDLFPEFFKYAPPLYCQKIKAGDPFPFEDKSIDVVICQEGIEHFSDQLAVLKEFSRVLKKKEDFF
jgi:ubiquinone/menaquinone biosynthesis C-methylase UbiE